MSVIRNIAIGRKFAVAFGLVCMLSIVFGINTFLTLRGISRENTEMSKDDLPSVLRLAEARDHLSTMGREQIELTVCQTRRCESDHLDSRKQAIGGFQAPMTAYDPLVSNQEEEQLLTNVNAAFAEFKEISDREATVYSSGRRVHELATQVSPSSLAGEVRRLAERTKAATEEISSTIGSIQEEIRRTFEMMQEGRLSLESGLSETERARRSLVATIEASKQVEHQINLIVTAATQQTAASGEISESARHISQLATESAQGAEEAVEALKNLALLAADMKKMIRESNFEQFEQSERSSDRRRRSAVMGTVWPAHA